MICPHCQGEIADGSVVCSNCQMPITEDLLESQVSETVAAPLPELKAPPKGLPGNKLFLSFSEKPDAIVRIMDEAVRKESAYLETNRKQLMVFTWLVPVGSLFIILDWVIGGNLVSLALVGYACWAVALIGWLFFRRSRAFQSAEPPLGTVSRALSEQQSKSKISCVPIIFLIFGLGFMIFPWTIISIIVSDARLTMKSLWVTLLIVSFILLIILYLLLWRRRNRGSDFGPKFSVARTIFETLKDDVSPKRTFTGWLDLTGMQQEGKLVHEKTSQSGMPVAYYRDEWLHLKAILYDGSLLRLSAVERNKTRRGRWKTSLRGRLKWKPGGVVQARETLRLVVAPNPTTQQVAFGMPTLQPETKVQIGNYSIESLQTQDGRLVCDAVSYQPVGAWDLLQVMKYAYSYIKPRLDATNTVAGQ